MTKAFDLSGETILITGGATGLGLGIARASLECGASVVLVSRNEERLAAKSAELGDRAHYRVHDVTEHQKAGPLVSSLEKELGPVTGLINNAGLHLKKPAVDMDETELIKVMDVHVVGAMSMSRAVAKGMLERKHGSIIFIASMTSFMGIPLVTAYSAAKSAHLGMVRSLSSEWSPSGVRVNAIAPGWIESDMLRQALANDPERERKILSRTHMGRFGEPSDIGNASAFLCSAAAKFITGQCLPVDGGASIGL